MAELRTLSINELQVGMFVKDIILKNSDHKVKNQGIVNSERTIALLKKQGVDKVVVQLQPEQLALLDQQDQADQQNKNNLAISVEENEAQESTEHQPDLPLDDELAQAYALYDKASEQIQSLFLQARNRQKISTDGVEKLALAIMQSVIKNEYAITILTRIRHHSSYQWEHAANCAILMCGFALFLDLKHKIVHQITIAALIHDIGNAKIPEGIISKPGLLSTHEVIAVEKHVMHGVDICQQKALLNPIIKDIILNHHERLDGSGYPRRVSEDKLSKLARAMAIVDVYDAITGEQTYKKAQQPIDAFRYLITNKNKFDPSIVQQFIKYLGVHPVGSVIQLSNERLAMVMVGNRAEPLKPKIKVFFNLDTMQHIKPRDIDLSIEDLSIVRAVNTEDFDINTSKLIKDFVNAT
ncbi:HD-GYP domain-containing protein [Thalassotalea piscium]|uniref:HD-GYP domain-containing protein (C-di-GMP phosphodiesterase class II) n=1 Tax=Thalassotalea piscium TaxID=1230533 RepID=A0A7X0NJX8_9GAMM|nr:HD-GYP domain-containing protein [Thalassotalea piscium]MBB6544824.1 HD-GYP domain-containing protein (c-di-GMP phosphodiesterase class II) [Thalassotalea piscium]